MKSRFKQLSEWSAQAADSYMDNHKDISLMMGLIDQSLRKQGVQADAISIESIQLNVKILIIVHDHPDQNIEFVLGNRNGDINASNKYPFEELSQAKILNYLEAEL